MEPSIVGAEVSDRAYTSISKVGSLVGSLIGGLGSGVGSTERG